MDTSLAFEFIARLLAFRTRVLQVVAGLVQNWYATETCAAKTIFRFTVQFFSSIPSLGGGSMTILSWIVVGTIVASSSAALLCFNKPNITLSEMAETLERRATGGTDPEERQPTPTGSRPAKFEHERFSDRVA